MTPLAERAVAETRAWLERAVIGLNLCPFAKSVHVKGQVHFAVCLSPEPQDALQEVEAQLAELASLSPEQRDTTLLVLPNGPEEFLAFNALVSRAERLLRKCKLEGVFQLASFHPRFQFAGTEEDDITNFTNRSPHPTLHLLRESSIDRAVQAFPEAEAIFEANMATLRRLGQDGWHALQVGPGKP